MLRFALSELSLEGEAIGAGELFVALEPRRHDHVVAVRASERDRGRLEAMVGAHQHRGPAFDGLYRALPPERTEVPRVGEECVRPCRSRWSRAPSKKKNQ